jgi:hypothetical protein
MGAGHGHAHHGQGHAHAPADFGHAFAIGTALNLAFVAVEAANGIASGSMALRVSPVHRIISPATTTPVETNASAAMCRNAADVEVAVPAAHEHHRGGAVHCDAPRGDPDSCRAGISAISRHRSRDCADRARRLRAASPALIRKLR